MKNFIDSDYAANKKASGIVYRFADKTVEITLEDYLRENPGKTATDFAELKAISDNDYYERDRSEYRQTWKNVAIDGFEEILVSPDPSPEDSVISMPEQAEVFARKNKLAAQVLAKLTDVQRRRYLLYHGQGKTYREIAVLEKVHFTSVEESVVAAEKRIKKILSKHG
jgi:DNA-directed RNA polymerase specialized sigma24 family protein